MIHNIYSVFERCEDVVNIILILQCVSVMVALASAVRTVCSSEEDPAVRHSRWYIHRWFDC